MFTVNILLAIKNNMFESRGKKLKVMITMDLGTRSHVKYLFEVCNTMRDRGHETVFVAPEGRKVYSIPYNITFLTLGKGPDIHNQNRTFLQKINEKDQDKYSMVEIGFKLVIDSYEQKFFRLLEYLKFTKPDLIICDFFAIFCADAARHTKTLFIISFQSIGIEQLTTTSYLTSRIEAYPTTTENLPFIERFRSKIIYPIFMRYILNKQNSDLNSIKKRFNIIPSKNIFGNWKDSIKIANAYTGFEDAQKMDTNINLVGPIFSETKIKEIVKFEKSLKGFLDNRERVVYISFGSLVIVPKLHIKRLMSVLIQELKKKKIDGVIWGLGANIIEDFPKNLKIDNEHFSLIDNKITKNIKILKWAPQTSILAHKNTKLFISHGGLESIYEAIKNAKKMLIMPYAFDQTRNAQIILQFGNGKVFNPKSSSSNSELQSILTELLLQESTKPLQAQIISTFNSKRKQKAADLLESYVLYSKKLNNKKVKSNRLLRTSNALNLKKQFSAFGKPLLLATILTTAYFFFQN